MGSFLRGHKPIVAFFPKNHSWFGLCLYSFNFCSCEVFKQTKRETFLKKPSTAVIIPIPQVPCHRHAFSWHLQLWLHVAHTEHVPCHAGTQLRCNPSQSEHKSCQLSQSSFTCFCSHVALCYMSVLLLPWMCALRKNCGYLNTQNSWRAVKWTCYSKQTRGKDNLCKVFGCHDFRRGL